MGISGAFSSSVSGLAATAKLSELTSGNIANANNKGYVKKTLITQSAATGGVLATGISREVDRNLDRMYRLEIAGGARQKTIAGALEGYSVQLGKPGDIHTISGQLSMLSSGFSLLSNAPSDVALQNNVLSTSKGLAKSLNDASNSLAQTRSNVSARIENDVKSVNDRLRKIASLNVKISQQIQPSTRRATLQDERTNEINALANLMDIKVTQNSKGNLNIATGGGTQLVDGNTSFDVSYNPALKTLNVGTAEITPGKNDVRGFSEGQLAGQFELLNTIIPKMQLQLDEFARSLIQGFEAADTSLAPGQAGLFTDLGTAYNPLQLQGLAGRISVNAAVDPNAGGGVWRIRDGVGATTQGAASDSTQTISFLAVLETAQSFDPLAGQGSSKELTNYISGMVTDQKLVQIRAQEKSSELDGRAATIQSARQKVQGVNLDAELQKLTMIEQSYAANSRVIQSLKQMIDTLLAAV